MKLYYSKIIDDLKRNLFCSDKPSNFLVSLKENNLIGYFPELNMLSAVPHDPKWHPEGSVWNHTLMVVDQAAIIKHEFHDEFDRQSLMIAALCHDLAKPYTLIYQGGRWRNPKHDVLGLQSTDMFCSRILISEEIKLEVKKYVLEHLKPINLYKNRDNVSGEAIKKLHSRLEIPKLLKLAKADHFGRTTEDAIKKDFAHGEWLQEMYKKHVESNS